MVYTLSFADTHYPLPREECLQTHLLNAIARYLTLFISAVVLFLVVFHLTALNGMPVVCRLSFAKHHVFSVITESVLLVLTILLAFFGFLLRWIRDASFNGTGFLSVTQR